MSDMIDTNPSLYQRARKAMPGGVSHELRFRKPNPVYVTHASGCRKWDVEGKEYIDFKMGSASQILGHSHPDVVEAISGQAARTPFAADCHIHEIEWAEYVNRLFPSADMTRFTASGTESTMLAIRLARAYSGKPKLIRIDGHFHGWHDHVMPGVKAGTNRPPSLGVPDEISRLTLIAPANITAIRDMISNDDAIGTLIVEASGANYGSIPLPEGFLEQLRTLADETGCVLIFDEIITGFRWSPGGLQARDGITPDLTTLAKILTGGLPGGGVCGRAAIMELLDPWLERDGLAPAVTHKGTFNASPLVAAGAVAAMKHLETGKPQEHAANMAERLRGGVRGIFDRLGIRGAVYGESSTFHIFFGDCDGTVDGLSPGEIRAIPPKIVAGLRAGLLAGGIDLMSHTSGVTSSAHGEEDIDRTLEVFDRVLSNMAAEGVFAQ